MGKRRGEGGNRASGFRYSVAMTAAIEGDLRAHLLRPGGQESLCLAIYQPSSGATRSSAVLTNLVLPREGETEIHGNVSFTGDYVLRVIETATRRGGGVAIMHSHPCGSGWQGMSGDDADAEASFANVTREITGLPLVGMTLAGGDGAWSSRFWTQGAGAEVASVPCENVRVIGDRMKVSWNPHLVPPPKAPTTQTRTVSCWGSRIQADIARLRILVVGAGSIGLDVAVRLAATGVQNVALMDFDSMKIINLDRMTGATSRDVWLCRSKLDVAIRLVRQNATARPFRAEAIEGSICEPNQFARALDYDLIFCCVDDHPWPRSVLNTVAYTDLIPVIDGGIHVDAFPDGDGMRNATWRSHVLRPGRPCMACSGQLDLGKILIDKAGLLEDETYIAGLPRSERPQSQNVAALAVSATASLLAQFVSFVAAPAGIGEPGPLHYSLSTHSLEHLTAKTREHCPVELSSLAGDRRQVLLGDHAVARAETANRRRASRNFISVIRAVDSAVERVGASLTKLAEVALKARRLK